MKVPSQETPPANPKKRLYYGWVIVGVVVLAGLVQTGQFNPTLGVFLKPITEEFGWSRSQFVGAHTIGTIFGGITGLFVGPALDRFGPRWIIPTGLLIIGGGLVGMAFVQELWQFYLFMIIGRVTVQGAVALALQVLVPKWFVRKRGVAMAVASMGTRVGNGASPLYAQSIVSASGWRMGMFSLGLMTWAVALIPSILFLRRQPEDMGLRPDGDPPETPAEGGPDAPPRVDAEGRSFTLAEALRTRTFWVLLFVVCAAMFIGGGVNLNILPFFADQGISVNTAVLVVTAWSFIGTGGTLIAGILADRLPTRSLLAASYVVGAGGVLLLSQTSSLPMAFTYAVVYGIAFGAMTTVNVVLLPNYFGRRYIGAIRGFSLPFLMLANALGPLIAAMVFDATDSYETIFVAFSATYLIGALALAFVAAPPKGRARA